jgi:hypothetical protein
LQSKPREAGPIGPLTTNLRPPINGPLPRVSRPIRAAVRWVQHDATQKAARHAVADAFEGASRLVLSTRLPSGQGLRDFVTHQILINSVAWTAGIAASGLVTRFFEVRGFRNLWGLTTPGSRKLVCANDYQLIMMAASFCSGLLMMILIRHFLLRWVEEVRSLRMERLRAGPIAVEPYRVPFDSPTPDVAGFEAEHDH